MVIFYHIWSYLIKSFCLQYSENLQHIFQKRGPRGEGSIAVPNFRRPLNKTLFWVFISKFLIPKCLFQSSLFLNVATILLYNGKSCCNCACEIDPKAKKVDPEGSKVDPPSNLLSLSFECFLLVFLADHPSSRPDSTACQEEGTAVSK